MGKAAGNGGQKRLWGDGYMIQYAHDVLFSCTLETCMVLRTNVIPINF